jgi:uncharacterized protein YabE (DUF348 family)
MASSPVSSNSLDSAPVRLGPRLLLAAAIALICATVCGGAALLALVGPSSGQTITIITAKGAYQTQTRALTVAGLLEELDIVLSDGDVVSPLPEATIAPGLVVRVEQARPVTVTVDGGSLILNTLFSNPLDILRSAGVAVGEHDRVWVDGTPASLMDMLVWPVPATRIAIRRAVKVDINDDGERHSVETAAETIGEALFEAGITLYLADTVSPDLNTPISGPVQVDIRRSRPITIVADGVRLETRSRGAVVADALADAGVTLLGLDYSIPDERSAQQPGMVVRVIRVTEQVLVQQDVIAFETVYQADSETELDQRRVLQEGQNGILQRSIRVRYENGIEISRVEEAATVASEPINRVIGYGTKIVLRTVDTPDGPREYWRKLRMYATSYHPAALGGDDVTATGRKLTKGIVGSDPRVIPYGTTLYVPNYGVGVMADTGMPTPRLWIDLGYDDASYVGWSRWVDVYLLTPVPEQFPYLLPY